MNMSSYPRSREVYSSFNLPIMQPAVNETTRNIQCSYRLSQFAALMVACLATQGLVDVQNPRGYVEPISLFSLAVAPSGEGKTATESIFKRGVVQFELAERDKYAEAIKTYETEMALFHTVNQSLKNNLRRTLNDGGDADMAQEALRAHACAKPIRPKLVRLCYEDTTPEAWVGEIEKGFPVSTMFSSEAAAVINGRSFGNLEKFNQVWSGGALSIDRKTQGSIHIRWCRLSLALMVQPEPFGRYLVDKGQNAKGLGFWARALICDAGSTQGTRFIHDGTISWEKCDIFTSRVIALLAKNAEIAGKEGYTPEVLEFSPEASAEWFSIYNWIERQIRSGGRYEGAGDHASKLSSNIARVAAVLHYFEGFEGKISHETLMIAWTICEDASLNYLKWFVPPPREIQDAIELNKWFDRWRNQGMHTIPKNYARKYCPNALRSEGRFYMALDALKQQGLVRERTDERYVTYIDLTFINYGATAYGGPDQSFYVQG